MTSSDFLNYTLGIGFLILVGILTYTLYRASQVFAAIRGLIENLKGVANVVRLTQSRVKFTMLSLASIVLNKLFTKGGEKNGKQKKS